jgi:hypothetical protein
MEEFSMGLAGIIDAEIGEICKDIGKASAGI